MEVLDSASEVTANVLNVTFSNDFIRMIAFTVSSILFGYTLRPVPNWLTNLFDTSILFKYLIIVFVGVFKDYPIRKGNLVFVMISSAIIMLILEGFRKVDAMMAEKNKAN